MRCTRTWIRGMPIRGLTPPLTSKTLADAATRVGVDRLADALNTCDFYLPARSRTKIARMAEPLESPGTLRPMLRLALPVLAEQFLATLVVYSETILAGQYLSGPPLGQAPLAAMTLLAYFMWLVTGLFAFVAIGSLAMTARFVGAGDMEMARRVTNQSLLAGLVLCGLLAGGLVVWLPSLIDLMNANGEVGALTVRYLYLVLPVLPAIMLTQVGPACLRGAGDTV